MNADALLHAAAANCPNCFAETAGNFCHQCSQETTLHPPSAREFLHEFIGHYVALEGKLWQSLWLLLVKPGRLTLEYIRGRRVRYVQPLRLYLTFSVIFFALVKFSGVAEVKLDASDRRAPAVQVTQSGPAPAAQGDNIVGVSELAARIRPAWGPKTTAFFALPLSERFDVLSKGFFSGAPYALFALMPVFALLLKLLYLGSGQRYGTHLLFALHANAFAFAMLALQIALPKSLGLVHAALLLWMVVYLPLAMRRVYGGGWTMTLLRWIVLMVLHLLCVAVAIVATLGSAVLA